RIGQYSNSTVRIVLDVGNIGRVTSFTLRDPDRVVIDVFGKETGSPPAEVVKAPPAEVVKAPPTKAPAPAPPTVVPAEAATLVLSPPAAATSPASTSKKSSEAELKAITPAKATNSGTRSLVRSLGLKLSRVVIDAGHGGYDTGTVGQHGYTEKELVLDVAQRLKQLIETELGAEVVMTRTNDNFDPLEDRTSIANQQQADLFISIHANSSRVRSVRGVETYF